MEPAAMDGAAVSLAEMLEARDRRAERQRALFARHGLPLLSVTLVAPGPVKVTETSRFVMETAADELERLFRRTGWPVEANLAVRERTGFEALYAVDTEARVLKWAVAALEDDHPLGRLWDLDVLCPMQGGLSRGALGLAPRRCLVCGEPAHACARSRRHPLDTLLAAIEERVNAFRTR
ncbi:citrate lyase holo-[acyl-carrier protein] synthase (plasmid) [Azospirillum humicireducens]|uniref:citrate lyase holo-[acyl-carrier protein] synthase n=1 Tax=Azospirillum humicireducens TaxID=1226968 RepID=A0A2R4VXS5_9PROT|nr:citrate lyase holo-[acyl-carrier protein] synthase [Azospirillum humicireducens]AWB09193.1 citrate lyase holo-[acyl-carrier protein] synthase [Azospirillum humicireducens]